MGEAGRIMLQPGETDRVELQPVDIDRIKLQPGETDRVELQPGEMDRIKLQPLEADRIKPLWVDISDSETSCDNDADDISVDTICAVRHDCVETPAGRDTGGSGCG